MQLDARQAACGAIFMAIGLFFALGASLQLRIGEAFSMGPGYFPVVLGSLLTLLGLAIAASAFGHTGDSVAMPPLRGIGMICLAVMIFATGIKGLGMLPTLLMASFAAGLAPRGATPRSAAIISLLITAFSIALFVLALRLPYPVIGPWLKI